MLIQRSTLSWEKNHSSVLSLERCKNNPSCQTSFPVMLDTKGKSANMYLKQKKTKNSKQKARKNIRNKKAIEWSKFVSGVG